jgi:predicted nucleotidyltransferase
MAGPPTLEQLNRVGARYRLATVYGFGSRASEVAQRLAGDAVAAVHPESDVDIGVQPTPGFRLNARDRVRLASDLEDLLGVGRVDLVILTEADPFLAVDVIRGELLYCADKDAQAEEELHILRRAGDLAPYARERWTQILAGPGS